MVKLLLSVFMLILSAGNVFSQADADLAAVYQYQETRDIVALVKDACAVIQEKGEAAFPEFKKAGSKWRHGNTYIFITDTKANMVLHPDPAIEGKNRFDTKDINGKFVDRQMIDVTTSNKKEGWVHYQWPEPGKLFPVWKSVFAKLVTATSGKKYIVVGGLYNPKIEKEFIIQTVDAAVELIEKEGRRAFPKLRDKTGPFIFKDVYVFVDDPEGLELVNGDFPNLEGRNLIDYQDSKGKYLVREYIDLAMSQGAGWLYYYWPKPGESESSKKHTYVRKAKFGNEIFIIGAGAYLD